MARKRFHGLKKVKIRASWNKYNLYNLTRLRMPNSAYQTYYQQKWSAKSATRAYHGEQIREGQWERMFTPRLNAVVPMDHRYLAEHDGSELAAGRGSGLEVELDHKGREEAAEERRKYMTPYMHMTYAPIERRLDMAIFRALFASSARQARQFVIHNKVKVNGKKMIYPGYLLNPGDMFQVDVDSVLFATGAAKTQDQKEEGRKVKRIRRRVNVSKAKFKLAGLEKRAEKAAEKAAEDKLAKPKKPQMQDSLEARKEARVEIEQLIEKADEYLEKHKKGAKGAGPGARKRQAIRAFKRKCRNVMGRAYRMPIREFDTLRAELLLEWQEGFKANETKGKDTKGATQTEKIAEVEKESKKVANPRTTRDPKTLTEDLRQELVKARENPVDPSKPYATPWQPRPFMSAFAFVPRFLEVNHKICSAVYLRHPVARPGMSEVPTPFPAETQQLAFNWYLRRR